MAPIARRSSISPTAFAATTATLAVLLAAIAVAAIILLFRRRRHQLHSQTIPSQTRVFSPTRIVSAFPSNHPGAFLSPRQTPPIPSCHPPSLPSICVTAHNRPPHNASRLALLNNPAHSALMARLAAMPLTSDTTDMSADTMDAEEGAGRREVVNVNYAEMLAARGISGRDFAMLGSDLSGDGTDLGDIDGTFGVMLGGGIGNRMAGIGGTMTAGERSWGRFGSGEVIEEVDEEVDELMLHRPSPLVVRKVTTS